jgi:hypothetical protein
MGAKVIQDLFYKRNLEGQDVFTLVVTKSDISSFGRSYTVPELQDIADTIISFLEKYYINKEKV